MARDNKINLNELWEIPDFLGELLGQYKQKDDDKFYEKDNNTLLSGEFTLDKKYSNGNTVLRIKLANGELKESTFFYPTGEVLQCDGWENGYCASSEQFHFNEKTSKIENYKEGLITSSKHFNENGEKEAEYNYKKDDVLDIKDIPNSLTTPLLIKNWLENGWEE